MPNELTNPNNVVTEERLAQFYQQILPYMGGMPDILANKFSKADLYSTDEKLIGRWIDGKPLYQKTCVFTNVAYGTSGKYLYHQIENIENIIDFEGVFVKPSTGETYLPNVYLANDYCTCAIMITTESINYSLSSAWGANTLKCTIKYTKTTDSAVEIGDDTDYSTTEKIVGTWIDGKPLYQRTVSFVSNGANWKTIGTDFDHSNWDSSFVKEISINTSSDGEFYGGNNTYGILVHTPSSLKDVFEVHCPSWSSGSTGYVTVCYTKASS